MVTIQDAPSSSLCGTFLASLTSYHTETDSTWSSRWSVTDISLTATFQYLNILFIPDLNVYLGRVYVLSDKLKSISHDIEYLLNSSEKTGRSPPVYGEESKGSAAKISWWSTLSNDRSWIDLVSKYTEIMKERSQ